MTLGEAEALAEQLRCLHSIMQQVLTLLQRMAEDLERVAGKPLRE